MNKVIRHCILWIVIAPWAASTVWFALEPMAHAGRWRWWSPMAYLPYAALYGILGLLYCLRITIPGAVVSAVILGPFPRLALNRYFCFSFAAVCAVIGFVTGDFARQFLNVKDEDALLRSVGALTGGILAHLTTRLWRSIGIGDEILAPNGACGKFKKGAAIKT